MWRTIESNRADLLPLGHSHRKSSTSSSYSPAGQRINSFSEVPTRDSEARDAVLKDVRTNFQGFLADREDGQSFLYSFNSTNTHRTWVNGSGKALWGLDPDSLKGKLPPFLPDYEVVREDLMPYPVRALRTSFMLKISSLTAGR